MDPVRILYLSDTGGQMGGAGAILIALVKRLDRSQFQPFAVLGSDGDMANALRGLCVDVTVAPLEPIVRSFRPATLARSMSRLIRGCRAVRAVCREKKIDIIHGNDNTVVFYAVLPAMMTGRKSVWHVHSAAKRLGCIGAFLVKHSTAIIFCSESVSAPFRRYPPKYTRKMVIAYESVNVPALIEQSNRPSIREEYRIPPDVPLVGLVGRVTQIKGQDVFLEAAAAVSKLQPRARFAIVGAPVAGSREALEADAAFGDSLQPLCEKLGIADRVIFTGYRYDVPAVMKDLSVLAVPSRHEGLGIVALEAMILGVPVVASSVDGLREVVQDGINGLLVPVDDAAALGLAITRLLEDKDLARRLVDEARRSFPQRFTADFQAKTITDVYRVIMGART